jgi:MFS family permease
VTFYEEPPVPAPPVPAPPAPAGFVGLYLPALRVRPYAIFFSGQAVSLIGSWMQIVAQGWLVYDLTRQGHALGLVSFCSAAPLILFSLAGGSLPDRYSKRNLLRVTNLLFLVQAATLATLTLLHVVTVPMIMALALLGGSITAVDAPTRLAMVVELVGKENVPNAVALNSILFNVARVVGPSLAGILLAKTSAGYCFAANAATFLATIIALRFIPDTGVAARAKNGDDGGARGVLRYLGQEKAIAALLVLVMTSSVLGFAWLQLMPVVAHRLLGLGVTGYASLMKVAGIGALGAGLTIIATRGKSTRGWTVLGGIFLAALALATVSFARGLSVALPAVAVFGFGGVTAVANINAILQRRTRAEMRGRVFGLYSMSLMGMLPLGSLLLGTLVDAFPPALVMRGAALALFLTGLGAYLVAPKLARLA